MRRGALLVVLLCALLLGGGMAVYRAIFGEPPRAPRPRPRVAETPPAPATDVLETGTFRITGVVGPVEARRNGVWAPAKEGDRIGADDAIRTGPAGRAVLVAASGDELTLRERVELEVDRLEATVTELTLTRGKVRAEAAPGTERLAISSAGAQAIGAGGGRFTVYADGRGAIAVASETGKVRVLARGGEVTLAENTQTYVPKNGRPRDPIPVPDTVFLQVAWPGGVHVRPNATLRGRVAPGAIVTVNGEPAEVGPDGRFVARVGLVDGKNPIAVVAESLDGKTRETTGEIVYSGKGPPLLADPSKMYEIPDAKSPRGPPKREPP